MAGLIGKKIGMTSIFDEEGRNVPCTVVQAGPCYVTQIRTQDNDGYEAVQIGFDDRKEKNTPKPLNGHFEKAGVKPKRKLWELQFPEKDLKLGDEIKCDLFQEGELVDVSGYSKGKGFQGVVKRHGFSGVGDQSHGQHGEERRSGSIGGASDPSRVFKGKMMAGRMGNNKTKIFDLEVLKVRPEDNVLVVKGAIPGYKGSYIIIER